MKIKNDIKKGALVITCTPAEVDNIVSLALAAGCRVLSHIDDKKLRVAGKSIITWYDDKNRFLALLNN